MKWKIGLWAAGLSLVLGGASPSDAATCQGNVVIGEGAGKVVTTVPNRAMQTGCFNDAIVDSAAEGANYGNHGEFVAEFGTLVRSWLRDGHISGAEAGELISAAARSNVGRTLTVRVIAFNDFHGNIDGSNLSLSGTPAGGVDYMAGLVKQLKENAPNHVVVSAGDLIGASPLNSALFHDEPTIETMNMLGLEFNAVGNHEFDEGREELLRMQNGGCHPTDNNSCQGAVVGTPSPFEGAKFKFLAANVVDTQSGKTLFPAYGVKQFKGIRVGFIGMTLEGTPSIVTPSGITGLEFRDEADTVNGLVSEFRNKGIDTIVVLIHEGGSAAGGINGCTGISGPIVDIVNRLSDAVDLVVSGHTHQAYNCTIPNSTGRNIPVTSAGSFSRLITAIDIQIDNQSKKVVAVDAENIVVDRTGQFEDITPVPEITNVIANYNTIVQPIANRIIGAVTADITRTRNGAGESALSDVIADAQLAATADPNKGGAVIAFMNTGGIRADLTFVGSSAGEGNGNVTYGEAFTVQPFGNSLVVKTLTGQQIYALLEQQWGINQFADGGRTLQVSQGFSYQHRFVANSSPLGGQYVCDGSVAINGVPIDKTANYRVTMNSFLATGGDNFTVFNLGTNQLGGDVDLDALEAFFVVNSPVPPGAQNRIQQVAVCP